MPQLIKTQLSGKGDVNTDALDKALKTALTGDVCYGLMIDKNGCFLVMADDAKPDAIAQALALAAGHNPDDKTPEQEKREQLQSNADGFRSAFDTFVDDLEKVEAKDGLPLLKAKLIELAKVVYHLQAGGR